MDLDCIDEPFSAWEWLLRPSGEALLASVKTGRILELRNALNSSQADGLTGTVVSTAAAKRESLLATRKLLEQNMELSKGSVT